MLKLNMDHAVCMKHICDSIWIFPDCDCCQCRAVMCSSLPVLLVSCKPRERSLDVGHAEGRGEAVEIKGRQKICTDGIITGSTFSARCVSSFHSLHSPSPSRNDFPPS